MGYEYKITFRHDNLPELDSFLRGLPNFEKCNADWYSFRLPENSFEMYDATIHIEDDGLYFCDHGMGRSARNVLIEQIKRKYSDVDVDDWEP